jgi:hypothetical protein
MGEVAIRRPPGGVAVATWFVVVLAIVCAGWSGRAWAAPCPNETLRIGPSANLPDCRAYEQATPVEKNGANANGKAISSVQAGAGGQGITFLSSAGFPGAEGLQQFGIYAARRSSLGWTTEGLLPPGSTGSKGAVLGWSEDLRYVFQAGKEVTGQPFTFEMTDTTTGQRTQMVKGPTSNFFYVGAANEAAVVGFESKTKLAGTNGVANKPNVYVWDRVTGTTQLASVLNTGAAPSAQGSFAGSYLTWSAANTAKGGPTERFYAQALHTLSSSGHQVFFTPSSTTGAQSQLYVRENPTEPQSAFTGEEECTEVARACTRQISRPNVGVVDPNGPKPAAFAGATPDGGAVIFTSSGKLTTDATTGPADAGTDLYLFKASAPVGERLTDISIDSGDPNGAEVKGVLGYSPNASQIYFVAAGAIQGSGAPAATCSGEGETVSGLCNLYLWEEHPSTHSASVAFVAQVSGTDAPDWATFAKTTTGNFAVLQRAQVSAGGGDLLFASHRPLTGYSNTGPCKRAGSGEFEPGPCQEFFLYRPAPHTLICVTCDPSGAPPLGDASLNLLNSFAAPSATASVLPRAMSSSGDRVFFETPDPLVPADTNGDAGCPVAETSYHGPEASAYPGFNIGTCQDVYEWEAVGSGSCTLQSAGSDGGCVYLLSAGTSAEPSYFADASESGDDVFIFTSSRLVGQDKDELRDIYDVKVGGGLAAQNPLEAPPCLSEGECKEVANGPPTPASSGTSSFNGPGNQATPPPPKPKKHKKPKKHGKNHHGKAGKSRAKSTGKGKGRRQ